MRKINLKLTLNTIYGMKSTHLRNLLFAVFCLFGFVSAQAANYSLTVEQHEGKYFKTVPARFNLAVVATALGTDAATLGSAFNSWQNATEETPWEGGNLLSLNDPVNGEVEEYTCDGNGFYMNREGGLDHWGSTEGNAGVWYVYGEADAENDLLQFNIGMSNVVPEGVATLVSGDQVTCNLNLKYGDKQVTFALTLKVIAPVVLPTPTTIVESELNVVGSQTKAVSQYPRATYDSDLVVVELPQLVTSLEADVDLLADELGTLLYCTQYNNAETVADGQGLKMAELTNKSTANEPGFWLAEVMDEGGEYTSECCATGWSDGTEKKFFIEQFAFDPETNELSCRIGQYPDAMKVGEQYFVNVYIIYGSKAYRVRYDLTLKEREPGSGMNAYVKMGETEEVVEQTLNSSYMTTPLSPDLDGIAETLGCEVSDLKVRALDSSQNFAASNTNLDGWWFDAEGVVTAWSQSTSAFWVDFQLSDLANTFEVGQHERNVLKAGDQASANLYFMYSEDPGSGYYLYKVTLKVIGDVTPENAFESLATHTLKKQVVPSATLYPVDGNIAIDLDEVESLIGTRTPTLYGWAKDEDITEGVNGEYSKAWSCSPYPGFWLNAEGRVSIWGDNTAKIGISYLANGEFQLFQYPGRNAVGDVFTTTLFLVNEESGDMITYNFNIRFVEEIGPDDDAEIVGEVSNILIPMDTELSIPFNLNMAAEALGVSIDELMDIPCLRGGNNGDFGSLCTPTEGISYNSETFEYDPAGDIYIVFDQNGDEAELTIMAFEVADDFSKNIEFCIDYDGKRFIYHAKLVSLTAYATGIEAIQNSQFTIQNQAIYDLSGRQIVKTQKGVYIKDGKKVVK